MLFPLTSAFEFDNVLDYDENTKTFLIENALGLGKDIATGSLIWGDSKVGVGTDVHVGTFTYTPLDEASEIQDLDLIDLKSDSVMTRGKQYKVLTYKTDDDYSWVCDEDVFDKDGNQVIDNCTLKEDGKIQIEEWIPLNSWLNSNSFTIGQEYTIGVFVDTEEGDKGDWIPTFSGVSVEQWSSWVASLDNNIIFYYTFDDNAGNTVVIDSAGNYNGTCETNTNLIDTATAKLGTAFDFTTGTDWVNMGGSNILNSAWAISFWMRPDDVTTEQKPIAIKEDDNAQVGIVSGNLYASTSGAGGNEVATSISIDTWYHVVFMYDTGTNLFEVWVDGLSVLNHTDSGSSGGGVMDIGADNGGYDYTGILDEVGLWNRLLTDAEISALYGEGSPAIYGYNCTESLVNTSWSAWQDTEACQTNDYLTQNRSLIEYDENDCSEDNNTLTYWSYQEDACNYCSYNVANTSWSGWANDSACRVNDTLIQNRSLISYDTNYSTCWLVTSIGSDSWNSGVNLTYWDYQSAVCDYCTPSLTNTSWSAWANESACRVNSTQYQSRYLIEYDSNVCGEESNTTYYDYQSAGCTYIPCVNAPTNTSWSSWTTYTSCNVSNLTTLVRSLVEYDANDSYCGNYTNVTYYGYNTTSCIYTPASSGQFSWSVSFDDRVHSYLLIFFHLVAIALLVFGYKEFSSLIFLICGMIMLFSDINYMFSFITLGASIFIATTLND